MENSTVDSRTIESMAKWFTTGESLLAMIFALAALIITLRIIYRPRKDSLSVKLLGSIMVISLCFGANHPAVYGLGIFIIATLVTELHFIEKLGALVWRRKEHQQYLLQKATSEEVESKRRKELKISEEELPNETQSLDDEHNPWSVYNKPLNPNRLLMEEAHKFHVAVHRALQSGKGPFGSHELKEEITISDRFNQLTMDALIISPYHHYVIEIRYFRFRDDLKQALPEVEQMALSYRNYLIERHNRNNVTPVIIVPRHLNVPNVFLGTLILRYDLEADQFHNEDRAIKILEAWQKAE
ncbi:MAG: hypothetical protein F3745_04025 [Nitrospinae bacterium]|nr:hypothetical protein [Nitrospinota bacterium]